MAYIKGRFTAWSYSRLAEWEECALRAKYKHLDKLPTKGSPAMERGSAIGSMAETYAKGERRVLPKELAQFKDGFKDLKARFKSQKEPIVVEEMWGISAAWKSVAWNDWNNCWARVKMDVAYVEGDTAYPIDHKTGKYRPETVGVYESQLELYSMGSLIAWPQVNVVKPRLWFLDQGITHEGPPGAPMVITRKDLPKLQKKWEKRVKPMLLDATFKPNPGNACRWCDFTKAKGGPCKY